MDKKGFLLEVSHSYILEVVLEGCHLQKQLVKKNKGWCHCEHNISAVGSLFPSEHPTSQH